MKRPPADSLAVAVLLTAMVAFGPLATDLYLPSLPALGAAFATDQPTVQLTLSVFLVAFAVSQLVYGPLSDRFGRRPMIIGGTALFAAATAICIVAPTIEVLVAGRFLQAVGACSGPVLGRAIVRDVYGHERAARVLAYMGAAMGLAPAIGPIIGGVLQAWLGWRANFAVLELFALASLVATWRLLDETNAAPNPHALRARQLVGNYARLLANGAYRGYGLTIACVYSGLFSFISGSSFLFINVFGLSPLAYGFCFAAIVVGYMAGAISAGRLTTRVGVDRLVGAGTAILAASGLAMGGVAVAGWAGTFTILIPMIAYMVGMGLVMPNAQAGAIGPFPRMAGAASALLGFMQFASAAVVGMVVAFAATREPLALAASIALCGLGAMLVFRSSARARRAARLAAD